MFVRRCFLGASLDEAAIELAKVSGTAHVIGDCVAVSRTNKALTLATSLTDNHGSNCYFGVNKNTAASTDTVCVVVPFQLNQIWEVDTNADTATAQVFQRCKLTDENTLANDGNDGTSASHIFEIIKLIGATTDKKVWVRIVNPAGQVSA